MPLGNETTRFVIQVGDGGNPETFAFTCGANSSGVTLTNNMGENSALDCQNPLDVPASIVRYLETQDTAVTIAGMVTTEAWPMWRSWADTATEKNVKLILDEPAINNGGEWILPAFLTTLQLNKSGSGKVEFDASIVGAGQRVWTAAT